VLRQQALERLSFFIKICNSAFSLCDRHWFWTFVMVCECENFTHRYHHFIMNCFFKRVQAPYGQFKYTLSASRFNTHTRMHSFYTFVTPLKGLFSYILLSVVNLGLKQFLVVKKFKISCWGNKIIKWPISAVSVVLFCNISHPQTENNAL